MHKQLEQIMDNKIQKDQRNLLPLLQSQEQKQGVMSKSRILHMPLHLMPPKG